MKVKALTRPLGISATAMIAAVLAQPAVAQEAAQDAETQSAGGIGDIIVTANKTGQNQQKAPLAITAVTSAELVATGIKDLQDVQRVAPSVRFQEQGVQREIYLRGIGSTNDVATEDPPNAFNFNGVYFQREATGFSLYDIEQVEVVPGPQNTLYGRSSLGGTVNVGAKKPVDFFQAEGLFEYGNYNQVTGTLVLNVPLSQDFAVRAAYNHQSHDGYLRSGAYDRNENGGRISILGTPTDRLTIYAWGMYDHQGGHGANLVNKGRDPVTGAAGVENQYDFLQSDPWNDTIPDQYNPFGPVRAYPRKYDLYAFGAQIDYDLGGATLTYVPGYTKVNLDNRYMFTAIPLIQINHSESQSHELRLSSAASSPLKWIAGAYAYKFDNEGHLFTFAELPANDLYRDPHSRSKGWALFGQASYPITDQVTVTVGGRYASDRRRVFGSETPLPYDHSKRFNNLDGKFGVDYQVTDKSLVYFNLQTGSQLGTFNTRPDTATSPALIKSPRLIAYSLGTKNRFLDDNLELNVEAFYYDYSNFIVSAFDAAGGSLSTNAKKYEIYGIEAKMRARVTRLNEFDISVGWLHARYKDFTTPFPVPGTGATDFSGFQGQYAPDWTITGGYQHTFELPGDATLKARVDSHYESSFHASFFHPLGGKQKPYTKTDASLTYAPAGSGWSVAAWIKNIENNAVQAATASGAVPGPAAAFLTPPRTYGLRLTASFE